jgi:hypothetical protein
MALLTLASTSEEALPVELPVKFEFELIPEKNWERVV